MGITILRHRPEREQDMTNIKVAAETYYLHDGKAYRRGDDVPSGASLLVRKGSPILPEVAERYSVPTEDAQNVTRVADAGATPRESRGVGVSSLADEGFKRIDAAAEVHRETAGVTQSVVTGGQGTSRQAAMMRSDMIEERVKGGGGVDASTSVIEPGTAEARTVASQGGGIGGAPINEEITRKLEQGEIEATARHTGAALAAADSHARSVRENEGGGAEGTGIKPSTMSPESSSTATSSSVTREIAPGGDQAAAKLAAEEEARRKAEDEAAQRATQQETRPPTDLS